MSSIKIRAQASGDEVTVKALITHPMQPSGQTDKKTGEPIPPQFIQEVVCEHKGKTVITALWSGAISKNPYLSFKFKGGAKGDAVKLSWTDNTGKSDSDETTVS